MNTNQHSDKPLALTKNMRRRYFLKGAFGILAGTALLLAGTFHKFFRFFFGPRLSANEETEIMRCRIDRLKETVKLRQLELEREQSNYILVASLSELNSKTGKYFIDYQMRPGLAFLGKDGLPTLLCAKCTHLGCTVGNQVDALGKILCPCHVSYFDVITGQPNANSPAKEPLPHIGWVLMDKNNKVIASRRSSGETKGDITPSTIKESNVYIVKVET